MSRKLSDFLIPDSGLWLLSYDRDDDERRQKEAFYGMKLRTMLRPPPEHLRELLRPLPEEER